MTVALRSPKLVEALISVDNAPIDAHLKSDFHQYIRGLQAIDEKYFRRQAEADEILKGYVEVSDKIPNPRRVVPDMENL